MHCIASPRSSSSTTDSAGCCNSDGSPRPGKSCAEKLLEDLDPMLRGLSARLTGADLSLREDFFQVGVAAVLTALERFDATKGLVEHFAARSARGSLLNYRRSLWRREREICVGSFAEVDADRTNDGVALSLQLDALESASRKPAFDAMDCRLIWEIAVTILTPNELRAVELVHLEGWQANEAALKLGVSAPRVTQLVSSALRKLRSLLIAN
jgi:RNA polymerase sigma factor (sigma-70 family)